MTPDSPIDPRQALEASLTALLLGELPPDQATFLRHVMSGDPELAKIYQRLKQTIELVRETETTPAVESQAEQPTLKLSDERRQALLQHFKTVAPKEFAKPPQRRVSWLIPVAAAVAFLALISSMMLPALSKAKSKGALFSNRTWSLGRRESPELQNEDASYLRSALIPKRSVDNPKGPSTAGGGAPVATASPAPPAPAVPPNQNQTVIVLPSTVAAGDRGTFTAALPPNGATTVPFNAGNLAYGGYDISRAKSEGDKPLMLGLEFDKVAPGALPALQAPTSVPPASGAHGDQSFTYYRFQSANEPPGSGLIASAGIGGGGGYGGGITGGAIPPGVTQPQYANRLGDDLTLLDLNGTVMRRRALEEKPPDKSKAGLSEVAGETSVVPGAIDPTTGLPIAPATSSSVGIPGVASEEALSRRYGRRQGSATTPAIDPTTGLPSGTVPAVDPTTGLPVAIVEHPLRAQLQNSNPLVPETHVLSLDVVGYVNLPPQGTNRLVLADSHSFYNDEEQNKKDNKAVLGKERSSIVLPDGGLRERRADLLDGFAANTPTQQQALKELEESIRVAEKANGATRQLAEAGTSAASIAPAAMMSSETLQRSQQLVDNERAKRDLEKQSTAQQTDAALLKPTTPIPVPQPEIQTSENTFSTFSLNVSDVSFKLAAASLEKGVLPDPASIRSEEFINAFDYRDPEAPPGVPIAFAWERSRYPFAQNRDLLRFSLKTAAQGRQAGRPLNLVLLLDNSGSMERADRVSIIREALRLLAAQLQPQDTFSVVTFARTARLRVDGVPGSQASQVGEELSKLTPQGGTNLGEAMDLAYQTALRHYLANGINRVVLLTDGAANLGDVEPSSLKAKVEANRKQGIALDCFGIGWEGYNDDLLEVLTRNGDGRYGFINTPEEAATEFAGQLAGALQVAASDVKVQVEFNPNRVTSYRQLGYAKHQLTKEQFRDNTVNAAQIGAAESGNALYVIEANPAGEGPLGTVRVRYRVPGTSDYQEREWVVPYTGNAMALEQSSPAMRLAATASAFSEWLATSPYAAEVTPDALLGCLRGAPQVYGADPRPQKLEWMLRQAKSLGGTK
jgi:Mg-chelatase subunit ChlD